MDVSGRQKNGAGTLRVKQEEEGLQAGTDMWILSFLDVPEK